MRELLPPLPLPTRENVRTDRCAGAMVRVQPSREGVDCVYKRMYGTALHILVRYRGIVLVHLHSTFHPFNDVLKSERGSGGGDGSKMQRLGHLY